MKNKICLITGANRGLGFETALRLAEEGAEIIMLGRDKAALEKVQREIIQRNSNPNIHIFIADLSSFNQIRDLSEQIHKKFSRIDVLVNNAGAVFSEFTLSEDRLEKTIAINHFSYFLLTYFLLDLLKNANHARIVNVASESHSMGKIDFESFKVNKKYNIIRAYSQSKLANMLFTFELAEKLKEYHITVNAVSPGRVKTKIGSQGQPRLYSIIWSVLTFFSSVSTEKGAKTSIFLASDSSVENITGGYFHKCKQIKPSKLSQDKTLAKKLWEESERITGVKY